MSDTPEVSLTPDLDDFTRGQLMLEIIRETSPAILPLAGHYQLHILLRIIAREKPGEPMRATPGMALIRFMRLKPELWKKVRPFVRPGSRYVYDYTAHNGKRIPYKL